MSYRIDPERPTGEEIRRIGCEQADAALEQLRARTKDGPVAAIHDARKRCKKIRGLLRLVRPVAGDQYRQINDAARDAARDLSAVRDAQAVLGTFDALVATHVDQLPPDGLTHVRAALWDRAEVASARAGGGERGDHAERLLVAARAGLASLALEEDGWSTLAGGLRKTYERGRKSLARAEDSPSGSAFHEWRKRAKYTWYHLRLLRDAAPSVLVPIAERFHELSDALGDAHDLVVLGATLRESPEELGGNEQAVAALRICDSARADLERRALSLGRRLYAEPSAAFVDRVGAYWSQRIAHGPEWAAGELADVHDVVDDLGHRTVEELNELARRLDVPSRSNMRKDDLIGAVRAAGGR